MFILIVVVKISLFSVCVTCPLSCLCQIDDKSRQKVSCILQGDSNVGIQHFVANIEKNTQVLEITTKNNNNPNWLCVGSAFQIFIHLEEFHIIKSNVQEITKHAFWGLKSLRILNLVHNNITQIQDNNFKGLTNLQEMYLDYNKIQGLLSGTFKYLTDLKILSLAENQLEYIEARVFERLGKLRKLNLNGNNLKEIYPEAFMDIQELRIFLCRRCGLRNINIQIYHFVPYLIHLDLGENNFFYLSNEEFYDLRNLHYLWLDGNYLSVVLEKTFAMQQRLVMLSLARNRLAKVTNSAFLNVSKLKDLDLSYNNLVEIEPYIFNSMSDTLERLDISGNKLEVSELKYTLQMFSKLRYLSLADLHFFEIPGTLFDKNIHLKSLNLSGNNLEFVSKKSFTKLNELCELDLSRNQFKAIDILMHIFENISIIYLDDNPFNCNLCNIFQVVSKLNQSKTGVYFKNLKCFLPNKLKSRTFESLRISELMHCDNLSTYEEQDNSNFFYVYLNEYKHIFIIIFTVIIILIILLGIITLIRLYCFSRKPEFPNKKKNFRENDNTQIKCY